MGNAPASVAARAAPTKKLTSSVNVLAYT